MKLTMADRLMYQLWSIVGLAIVSGDILFIEEFSFSDWISVVFCVLFLSPPIILGGRSVVTIFRGQAQYAHLVSAYFFPIWGFWIDRWSRYRREENRLRDEEIGNTLGQLGRAKSDDEYKARLRRVANAFGSLGSLEALSEHSLVRSWSETLAEAMKLHRQRQAMESLYVRALSDGLKLLVNEEFITPDLAKEIGDQFELNVDGEISSYETLSRAAVSTEAADPIEEIEHRDLPPARKIIALLELEGIEMDFE